MITRATPGRTGGAPGDGPVSIRGSAGTDPRAANAATHVSNVRSMHIEQARAAPAPGGRSIPAPVLLLVSGMVATVGLVVLAATLRSTEVIRALESVEGAPGAGSLTGAGAGAAGPLPAPARERATPADMDAAKARGVAGLESLSLEYPRDPAVWRALLLAQGNDPAGQRATLRAASRLLELAPESATDVSVRTAVRNAAGGPPEVAAQALDLMATRMGSVGPDLLYDLMLTNSKLTERAAQMLADPQVIARESPALRIALELRAASSCVAKKALLERAARDGDRRAIDILLPLTVSSGKGCGFLGMGLCPAPCTGVVGDMRKAIEAIKARETK